MAELSQEKRRTLDNLLTAVVSTRRHLQNVRTEFDSLCEMDLERLALEARDDEPLLAAGFRLRSAERDLETLERVARQLIGEQY
jgi:hypothetical protein